MPPWKQRGSHALFQDIGVRDLGVSEVHDLIQQLIRDDEVVPNALLLQLTKVLLHDLPHPTHASRKKVWAGGQVQ